MLLKLTEKILGRLCEMNSFSVPKKDMIFFGLRGLLPVDAEDHSFKEEQAVELIDVNYLNPRCTLGQWLPGDKKFAIFPGSTVPHQSHISESVLKGGKGTNQLMTGYYSDYRKGVHRAGSPTAHDAFRQVGFHPIRRTSDDLDFDNDDRVEYVNPNDNIHAGWCMGLDAPKFASAGCQILIGYPKCKRRGQEPATGPWKSFQKNAYDITQTSFDYMLLNGRDIFRLTSGAASKISARLRFGSQGDLVKKAQKSLKDKGFYEGKIDGDFGNRTLRAVLQLQTTSFGSDADDGIIGPQTASALRISWPNI